MLGFIAAAGTAAGPKEALFRRGGAAFEPVFGPR